MSVLKALATTLVLALAVVPIANAAAANHPSRHRRGCNTRACDRRIDRVWARLHRERRVGFRKAVASYYGGGPGACGGGSIGVANKTLPCGTRLTVCSQRCMEVRVIDRGPYISGREFDLTTATAEAIGFPMSRGVASVRVAVR